MTVYSVYEPPSEATDLAERADKLAFVKEGFSWPALLVPLLWLLYYRMWIEFIVLALVYVALQVVFGTDAQGQALSAWASFAIGVLFAFEANDLRAAVARAARLPARGRGERARPDRRRAIVLHRLAAAAGKRGTRAGARRGASSRGRGSRRAQRGEGEEVIGLFPQA